MKLVELRNQNINAEKVPPELVGGTDIWQITYEDKGTGDLIMIRFDKETRDAVLNQLRGGVVLATVPDIPKQ